MKNWRNNPLLWIGFIGMMTLGTRLAVDMVQTLRGDPGCWWTHQQMRLPVEETANVFQLYVGDKALQKHLDDGTLFATDAKGEHFRIVSKDVSVRMNNWQKQKAFTLQWALFSAFGSGVSATLFLIGLFQSLAYSRTQKTGTPA